MQFLSNTKALWLALVLLLGAACISFALPLEEEVKDEVMVINCVHALCCPPPRQD